MFSRAAQVGAAAAEFKQPFEQREFRRRQLDRGKISVGLKLGGICQRCKRGTGNQHLGEQPGERRLYRTAALGSPAPRNYFDLETLFEFGLRHTGHFRDLLAQHQRQHRRGHLFDQRLGVLEELGPAFRGAHVHPRGQLLHQELRQRLRLL